MQKSRGRNFVGDINCNLNLPLNIGGQRSNLSPARAYINDLINNKIQHKYLSSLRQELNGSKRAAASSLNFRVKKRIINIETLISVRAHRKTAARKISRFN